ncbi:PadR family transcriptional regulator [soil metagenome]
MSEMDIYWAMLKPAALHILLALADRESHGYALMQAIRVQSGGQVSVQTASFYRHLGRLMDDGLVAEAASRPAGNDARRGAYYRITPRGRQMLETEKQRLTDLVAQMKRIRTTPRKAGA